MKSKFNFFNNKINEHGITLIVLIITVIIMLILAGVAINVIMSDNGLFDNIKNTKEKYILAGKNEEIKFQEITEIIDNYYQIQANKPKISQGMIPIKYVSDKNNWYICSKDDPEWYSYTVKEKKWANVMLCDGKYNTTTPINTEVKEDELGSMFVWIPRYAYKITEGYHQNDGAIDVVWLRGNTYNYIDSFGNEKTARNGNEVGVITSTGYTDYVVHPAFTDGSKNSELSEGVNENYSNGEWKTEIEGIWVAKFDAGFATTDEEKENVQTVNISSSTNNPTAGAVIQYPVFKGGKYAYNYVSNSQCYDLSLALDDVNNPYGILENANSHLIKNSEWGCVAYLAISKYGYAGGKSNIVYDKYYNNLSLMTYGLNSGIRNPNIDNESYYLSSITGYTASARRVGQNNLADTENYWFEEDPLSLLGATAEGNLISYRWNNIDKGGTKSSTTENIYGIYDMGGGVANYTASYIYIEGNSNLEKYGGSFANGISTYLATAYPYQTDTSIDYSTDKKDFDSAYFGFYKIFGDAIYELSSGLGENNTWFSGRLEEDSNGNEPFYIRGGIFHDVLLDSFCSLGDTNGNIGAGRGFRSVLIIE